MATEAVSWCLADKAEKKGLAKLSHIPRTKTGKDGDSAKNWTRCTWVGTLIADLSWRTPQSMLKMTLHNASWCYLSAVPASTQALAFIGHMLRATCFALKKALEKAEVWEAAKAETSHRNECGQWCLMMLLLGSCLQPPSNKMSRLKGAACAMEASHQECVWSNKE